MTSPTLLTTRDVADLLRVHPKHVYRLLKRGLPAVRVGDEWRYEREAVLHWAAQASRQAAQPVAVVAAAAVAAEPAAPAQSPSPALVAGPAPPLLAANGDRAVELVLEALRDAGGPLLGLVLDDHAGSARLLASGQVLVAGQHGGNETPPGAKWARLHLMTREVGLCARARLHKLDASIAGRRIASRPPTAGVRRRLDAALTKAGADLSSVYRNAVELESHRAVVLAVGAGRADVGLTTHAWAASAGLQFRALGSESYELVVQAASLGDARIIALAELLQSGRLRKRLRDGFGYGVNKTGELRVG